VTPENRARHQIRQRMLVRGLNDRQLGGLAQVPHTVIYRWRKGERGLTVQNYLKICHAIGLDGLPFEPADEFDRGYAAGIRDALLHMAKLDYHAKARLGQDWRKL